MRPPRSLRPRPPHDARAARAVSAAATLVLLPILSAVPLIVAPMIGAAVAQDSAGEPSFSEPPPPERVVVGNRLVSARDPAIEVWVPESARYLGARRILIDDRFDAELHVFAEHDEHGLIERFYWLQFERFLPDAEGRYDYRASNPETVEFDGLTMHVRPGGENTRNEVIRPGSDYEAFRALVDGAGLRLPNWLSTLRLVHLPEPSERIEFIVFYGEGPDALAEAAAEAMMAGEPGLVFADMLPALIADVDALVDITPPETR